MSSHSTLIRNHRASLKKKTNERKRHNYKTLQEKRKLFIQSVKTSIILKQLLLGLGVNKIADLLNSQVWTCIKLKPCVNTVYRQAATSPKHTLGVVPVQSHFLFFENTAWLCWLFCFFFIFYECSALVKLKNKKM